MAKIIKYHQCSFCGLPSRKVEIIIASSDNNACICNECIDACVDMVDKIRNELQKKEKTNI